VYGKYSDSSYLSPSSNKKSHQFLPRSFLSCRYSITQKILHAHANKIETTSVSHASAIKPSMFSHNIQACAALSASWISSAACVYLAYWITEPRPIIDINFIYDSNAALVNVKSASNGVLKEVKTTHHNLDCLQDKGYIIKRPCTQPYEPLLYIENAANRYSISDDCAACRVATEIEYSSLFGRRKELLEWAPQANHQLLRVKPHPTHKQQNLPEKLH
jgi:uncharacterized MAPEG superfamily protein